MRTSMAIDEIMENYRHRAQIFAAIRRKKKAALGLLPDQRVRAAMNRRRQALKTNKMKIKS